MRDKGYNSFLYEIWKCYKNADEIKGNQNLRDLNIEKIIKEAFMSVPEFEECCNLRILGIVEYGISDEEIEAILQKLEVDSSEFERRIGKLAKNNDTESLSRCHIL